jgi:hypothetical protein
MKHAAPRWLPRRSSASSTPSPPIRCSSIGIGRSALGAQAGEKRLREVIGQAGFGRIRRAAETPFNVILEARD